ncbi:MAG: efflux RND transporter periplasmic adaptor subunit [Candidatus Spyradocola sp.]
MASKKKRIWITLAVVLVVVVAAGVGLTLAARNAVKNMPAAQMMAMLNGTGVTELQRTDLTNTVSVSGNVSSASVTKVYLEATGAGKATQVSVKVGDSVSAGDVLCTFDTEKLQKEYDKSLLQADQSEERAQNTLSDAQNSYANSKIAQDQAVKNAEDNLKAAQKKLDAANDSYIDALDAFNKGELVATLQTDADYTKAQYNYSVAKEKSNALYLQKSQAEQALTAANESGDPERIAEAEQALNSAAVSYEAAQAQTDQAQAAMDAARKLFESKEVDAESVLDDYRDAVKDAEDAVADAEKRLSDAQTQRKLALSSSSNSIDNAKISADQTVTQMNLDDALDNIEKCTVTAPVSGTVTAVYVTEGESSATGSMLFVIEDLSDLEIKTTVKEYDVGQLSVGMPVTVKADSTGTATYSGTVREIGVTAVKDARGDTVNSSTAEFDITIAVEPGDGRLLVGMNARATIAIESKQDALAVLYSAVAYDADGTPYVMVGRKNDKGELVAQKVPVTTGVETDYEIEIFSDELTEGDLIVDDPDGVVQGQIIPYMG